MTQHRIIALGNEDATRITPNGLHSGMDITLQNINDLGNVYVGAEGVTSSSYGFKLLPNHSISFELPGNDSLFAIGANEDAELAVLQIGLESQN